MHLLYSDSASTSHSTDLTGPILSLQEASDTLPEDASILERERGKDSTICPFGQRGL